MEKENLPPAKPPTEFFRGFIAVFSFAGAAWLILHYFASVDNNLAFKVVPLGFGLTILWTVAANLIGRKGLFWKFHPSVITALFLSYALLLACGLAYVQDQRVAPVLKAFAVSDFAEFDPTNSGVVSGQQLLDVVRKNSSIEAERRGLASAEAIVSDSHADADIKAKAMASIEAIERADKATLRPAEQISRMNTVSHYSCSVGTQNASTGSDTCEVSRAQLMGYDELLAAKYPLWQKFFELVHQL